VNVKNNNNNNNKNVRSIWHCFWKTNAISGRKYRH